MNYTSGSRIPQPRKQTDMRKLQGRDEIADKAADLLADESSLSGGWCTEAVWPESFREAVECVRAYHDRDVKITISGGLTGISGGAVPDGGVVVSSAFLKGIEREGDHSLRVMAGTTLEELNQWLDERMPDWFYPPDPTETTASIGGTVATDASGSDSYLYGSTRNWIGGLEIVLPDGRPCSLRRGDRHFDADGNCEHPILGRLTLPLIDSPPPPKNAAGYWIRPGMDLIDLFIGSEGTLGFVASALLSLAKKPEHVVDLGIFVGEAGRFWSLYDFFRRSSLRVRALEMMDGRCLSFLSNNRQGDDLGLPADTGWVLLTRLEADTEDELDELLITIEEAVENTGLSPDMVWGGFEPHERKRLRDFRHTLPETVNTVISQRRQSLRDIHKLGTDSAVPADDLREFYGFIEHVLSRRKLDFLVFGHAGQGHLHANILPCDRTGEREGESALREIAEWAVSRGGTVSAEHGLGRLKSDLLGLMYSPSEIEGMRRLRKTIDPDSTLAHGIEWP
jgi:D-lactate dehydrogenase (cytochrome)